MHKGYSKQKILHVNVLEFGGKIKKMKIIYKNYVTIPNIITLFRLLLVPIFVFCLYKSLMITSFYTNFVTIFTFTLFIVIRISDFIDGWLARLTNSTSVIGCYFDVWVDFVFVISSLITLNFLNIIPIWITLLASYKFFEFIIFSQIIKKYLLVNGIETDLVLYYDTPGRIASSMFYTLPGLVLVFKLLGVPFSLIQPLCYVIFSITIVSSILKCFEVQPIFKTNFYKLSTSKNRT